MILNTPGSMDPALRGMALSAIAGYSQTHKVPAARVVFCDAAPYDMGYRAPAVSAGRVQVKGRGGTIFPPGVDLLKSADDFPPDGPILIITNGQCDHVHCRRNHARRAAAYPYPPVVRSSAAVRRLNLPPLPYAGRGGYAELVSICKIPSGSSENRMPY